MKLEGIYFDGNSSSGQSATLTRTEDGLELSVAGSSSRIVTLHSVSDRLGGLARKVHFLNGGMFECSDSDGVDALLGRQKSFINRLSRWESSIPFMAAAAVACIVLLFGLFRYGLPAMAAIAADVTPPAVVRTIDSGALRTVDRVLFSDSALAANERQKIQSLFDELASVSGESELPLQLLFRDGGRMGANAIALPGGTIIVTDQLAKLAEKEDEIAGVLAHEIGHVYHRHSLKQIYRVLGIGFMISVVGGDSGQIVEDLIAQAALLENLSYSRAFEAESDRYSVELMQKVGRDPIAFVDLLDRIIEPGKEGDTGWLSTHPGNTDRRKAVEQMIGASGS